MNGTIDEEIFRRQVGQLVPLVNQLRARRLAQGFSTVQAAKIAGLDPEAIRKLESGNHVNPFLDTLFRYAYAVGYTIELKLV